MTDLDLMMAGVLVTFLAVSGAYVAMRHRANETPVDSYKPDAYSYKARSEWYTGRGDRAPSTSGAESHLNGG